MSSDKNIVPFPYEIKKVDEKLNRELTSYFKGERTGFLQVGPEKWFLSSSFETELHDLYNFQPRKDDVWVVTYPRSGTTVTQEMIWLLFNNMDVEKAKQTSLMERFPFLEFDCICHKEYIKEWREFEKDNTIDPKQTRLNLEKTIEKRFIKSHLPFSLLHQNLLDIGCKVIYVARNPKNVAVSFYHHNRLLKQHEYIGDFKRYWNYFQRNLQLWSPYWEHVKEGWNARNDQNVLFLFYEDLVKDLHKTIEKTDKFLGTNQSKENIDKLAELLKFENFKKEKSEANSYEIIPGEQSFVRKGKNGGFEEYFDEQMMKEADEWIADNMKDTDLQFPDF